MKIPRKKEKPEQPVIVLRITRLPAWYELTKRNQVEEQKVVVKKSVYIQASQDPELGVLPDGGRRLW